MKSVFVYFQGIIVRNEIKTVVMGKEIIMNKTVKFNNGVEMPLVGLGLFAIDADKIKEIVDAGVAAGYRMFDTAQYYGTEKEVGDALSTCWLSREEMFITTKIYSISNSFELAQEAVDFSLKNLKTDYIDLMLVHAPYPEGTEMYKGLEAAYKAGKVRAIGISTYNKRQLDDLLENIEIIPAINQMETHIYHQNIEYQKYLLEKGITMTAWSPLSGGVGNIHEEPLIKELAAKYGKTTGQIALRNLVQRGIPVIPRTSKPARLAENIALFDFELSEEDMNRIAELDKDQTMFDWMEEFE